MSGRMRGIVGLDGALGRYWPGLHLVPVFVVLKRKGKADVHSLKTNTAPSHPILCPQYLTRVEVVRFDSLLPELSTFSKDNHSLHLIPISPPDFMITVAPATSRP
jgi:hypothetical protein